MPSRSSFLIEKCCCESVVARVRVCVFFDLTNVSSVNCQNFKTSAALECADCWFYDIQKTNAREGMEQGSSLNLKTRNTWIWIFDTAYLFLFVSNLRTWLTVGNYMFSDEALTFLLNKLFRSTCSFIMLLKLKTSIFGNAIATSTAGF